MCDFRMRRACASPTLNREDTERLTEAASLQSQNIHQTCCVIGPPDASADDEEAARDPAQSTTTTMMSFFFVGFSPPLQQSHKPFSLARGCSAIRPTLSSPRPAASSRRPLARWQSSPRWRMRPPVEYQALRHGRRGASFSCPAEPERAAASGSPRCRNPQPALGSDRGFPSKPKAWKR